MEHQNFFGPTNGLPFADIGFGTTQMVHSRFVEDWVIPLEQLPGPIAHILKMQLDLDDVIHIKIYKVAPMDVETKV